MMMSKLEWEWRKRKSYRHVAMCKKVQKSCKKVQKSCLILAMSERVQIILKMKKKYFYNRVLLKWLIIRMIEKGNSFLSSKINGYEHGRSYYRDWGGGLSPPPPVF